MQASISRYTSPVYPIEAQDLSRKLAHNQSILSLLESFTVNSGQSQSLWLAKQHAYEISFTHFASRGTGPSMPVACDSPALSIRWFPYVRCRVISPKSADAFWIPRPPVLLLQLRFVTFLVAKDASLDDIDWHSLHHCH
jgi:hypothetical protein